MMEKKVTAGIGFSYHNKKREKERSRGMQLNLQEVPFSMRGSYMAVSYHEKISGVPGMAEGLYLRTVHGDARTPFVARLQTLNDGEECPCRIEAQPER